MKVQIVKIPFVKESEKEEMFYLHQSYFANDKLDTFLEDMSEKNWIIILGDDEDGGKILGFSTIQVIESSLDNETVIFVYTGDTIVDKNCWQSNLLAPAFGHFMLRMIDEYDGFSIYWYLISKGYRTYRFLPVYFNKYYPIYTEKTPPHYDRLLQLISKKKWGENYNPETGIVSFSEAKDHLNDEMCRVPESKKKNPHINFFLEKNPDYYIGNELACIAEISKANLNRLAYRVIESRAVEWVE
ncbi:MAG: hypothetical protein GY950_29340 [bacterium]|nr:hypothetical protein [bacterium]